MNIDGHGNQPVGTRPILSDAGSKSWQQGGRSIRSMGALRAPDMMGGRFGGLGARRSRGNDVTMRDINSNNSGLLRPKAPKYKTQEVNMTTEDDDNMGALGDESNSSPFKLSTFYSPDRIDSTRFVILYQSDGL